MLPGVCLLRLLRRAMYVDSISFLYSPVCSSFLTFKNTTTSPVLSGQYIHLFVHVLLPLQSFTPLRCTRIFRLYILLFFFFDSSRFFWSFYCVHTPASVIILLLSSGTASLFWSPAFPWLHFISELQPFFLLLPRLSFLYFQICPYTSTDSFIYFITALFQYTHVPALHIIHVPCNSSFFCIFLLFDILILLLNIQIPHYCCPTRVSALHIIHVL